MRSNVRIAVWNGSTIGQATDVRIPAGTDNRTLRFLLFPVPEGCNESRGQQFQGCNGQRARENII